VSVIFICDAAEVESCVRILFELNAAEPIQIKKLGLRVTHALNRFL
jgi:hypothetical protein